MTSRVERFSGNGSEWDAFVRRQAGWTHFHLAGWKTVIERVFGHECLYLVARDETDRLIGVLPLVRVRSLLFGHYLVSMPFLNYGGPLGSPQAIRELVDHAISLADGASLLELRSRSRLNLDLPASQKKVTVLLDLPDGDAEPLWRALKSKVRSQVRRPRKAGVTVRFGHDQLEPFFDVFARGMRDLGTPTQSRELFETIAETFPDDVRIGCAYLRGQPVAVGYGLHWNGEFEMTWASFLREYSREAPNMLLYWRFIEQAVEEGMSVFNFGRCTRGGGTHRFKRQWGGHDHTLFWYQRVAGKASTPSPDDPAYAWGPKLWRRLPLPAANALGPRIVQYIP